MGGTQCGGSRSHRPADRSVAARAATAQCLRVLGGTGSPAESELQSLSDPPESSQPENRACADSPNKRLHWRVAISSLPDSSITTHPATTQCQRPGLRSLGGTRHPAKNESLPLGGCQRRVRQRNRSRARVGVSWDWPWIGLNPTHRARMPLEARMEGALQGSDERPQ